MNQSLAKWYAIHTRSRFEQKVYDGFCSKSIETFLPKVQVMSRRKDRRKKILIPMLAENLKKRINNKFYTKIGKNTAQILFKAMDQFVTQLTRELNPEKLL